MALIHSQGYVCVLHGVPANGDKATPLSVTEHFSRKSREWKQQRLPHLCVEFSLPSEKPGRAKPWLTAFVHAVLLERESKTQSGGRRTSRRPFFVRETQIGIALQHADRRTAAAE
jgi:hypothetical protein